MKPRPLTLMPAVLAAALLSACQTVKPVNLKASTGFDAERLRQVKKVAIAPFFYASALGTDDPAYKGKWSDVMPTINVYEGVRQNARFQIVPQDDVMEVLKKHGFDGIKLAPGEEMSVFKAITSPDKFRGGMTMQQALAAGRELEAAVLIGSFGLVGDAPANMRFVMAMRLVDPDSGRVLWGGARSEPMKVSVFSPFESQKKQMREMAARLLAEVP